MDCSICKKPTTWVFELLEEVPGKRPERRKLCFPCVSDLGEKIMVEYRRKQMAEEAANQPKEVS
jgi:hypothetical protein